MSLQALMAQFASCPNADVGYGPKHSTNPMIELEAMLEDYFRSYPHLSRFSEYAHFLECYAGASIGSDPRLAGDFMVFLIYGIDNFDDPCANLLRPDGFHIFRMFRTTRDSQHVEYCFAFNTNDAGDFGVYRKVALDCQFERHQPSFLSFLTDVVHRCGKMM